MSIVDRAASGIADRPRTVSGGVTIAAFLGGRGAQTAWALLVLCLPLFWHFAMDPDFTPVAGVWKLWPTTEVSGVVQEVIESEPTDMWNMWGSNREMMIITIEAIRYGYMGPDGTPYTGIATGLKQRLHDKIVHVGAPVTVFHSVSDPERSYIKGLSVQDEAEYQLKGAAFWIAVLVSTVSLTLVVIAIRRGLRLMELFTRGVVAQARICAVQPIRVLSVFGVRRVIYALNDSEYDCVSTLSCAPDDKLTGEDEPVLHIPNAPDRAVAFSLVPGRLQIDGENHASEGDSNTYNYLWLPALCMMGYLWFLLSRMGLMSPPWVF